ncbi:MAG: PEP-CTERM sorting domain-containing protein [Cyanobacteria bacterium P01_G01_bin.67]
MIVKNSIWLATVGAVLLATASIAEAVSIDYRDVYISGASVDGFSNLGSWNYNQFASKAIKSKGDTVSRINSKLNSAHEVWSSYPNKASKFSNFSRNTRGYFTQYAFSYDAPKVKLSKQSGEPSAHKVPEPLTILGSVTAIGMGILLKRNYAIRNQLKSKQS